MFFVKKEVVISAAHFLSDYNGPCQNLHGHNWKVTVLCRRPDDYMDDSGMVVDFSKIKKVVKSLDHTVEPLNHFVENPTAENIAKYIYEMIEYCIQVSVEETPGSIAIYNRQPAGRIL